MATDTRTFDSTNATTNGAASITGNDAHLYSAGSTGTQAGSAFFNDTVSLDADFTVTYTATIANSDGIGVVFHNDARGASALGLDDYSIGFAGKASFNTGIQYGLAVEFDTRQDNPTNPGNDINDNHSALRYTGTRGGNPQGNLTEQVNVDSIVDLDDGSVHAVQLDWTAATNTLTWSLNGTQITSVSYSDATIDAFFQFPADGADVARDVHIGVTSSSDAGAGAVVQDFTVTADFACFARGTRIATPAGETLVEDLQIGDLVRAADGRDVPVKWVGTQTVMTRFKPAERLALVRFAAGSLGHDLPRRDLMVTTDHAMLVDGVLCHAGALVNGDSIVQIPAAEMGESYTVYHIETDAREIILAEGAETETFIDNVSRRVFDNYAEFEALYGDVDEMVELPLPRALSHRQVPPALRKRLGAVRVA
ncbi:MAG: Hint domain-containing protein [Marinibacterium sp.]|nr:Hint domain-containing protein [Marinibacterium sp.]